MPFAACSATARTVGAGEWPVIAAVSAEAEVDVLVAVDVAKARTFRFRREDREAARPADHPRHRHPGQ